MDAPRDAGHPGRLIPRHALRSRRGSRRRSGRGTWLGRRDLRLRSRTRARRRCWRWCRRWRCGEEGSQRHAGSVCIEGRSGVGAASPEDGDRVRPQQRSGVCHSLGGEAIHVGAHADGLVEVVAPLPSRRTQDSSDGSPITPIAEASAACSNAQWQSGFAIGVGGGEPSAKTPSVTRSSAKSRSSSGLRRPNRSTDRRLYALGSCNTLARSYGSSWSCGHMPVLFARRRTARPDAFPLAPEAFIVRQGPTGGSHPQERARHLVAAHRRRGATWRA